MKNNPQTGSSGSTSTERKAAEMSDRVAAQVESTVSDLAERGREASRSVREVTDNFGSALDRSLERQPMTTLAMAVAVGFVLGALWKA
jgi:ElaB/YqjD/DUF883 family membrane-anchored ribosome-binding protein